MLEQHQIRSRSFQSRLLSAFLRTALKPLLTRKHYNPVRSRERLERTMGKRKNAQGVAVKLVNTASANGEWHIPLNPKSKGCIFYIHGGGYFTGSARVYRSMTTRLAQLAGMRVFSLDYRLAPENPFPAAVDDAVAAYEWLLDQGLDPEQMVVAGDSAGGGICLALIHALKEREQALPARVMVFSPWADLLATGASLQENSRRCAMFDGPTVPRAASVYLQGADGSSPLASPLYGDFSGFPELSIHVSDSEAIRDDGLRVAEKADRAGVKVTVSLWHRQPHAWPAFYPLLPEADQCLMDLAEWAKELGRQQESVVVPLDARRHSEKARQPLR